MTFYAGHHDQARMQGVLEGFKHSPLTPGVFFLAYLSEMIPLPRVWEMDSLIC